MRFSNTNLREHRERLGLSQARLAELSGIPQYVLSAAELGKTELSPKALTVLSDAFSNQAELEKLVTRNKRYREHQYVEVPKLKERIAKAVRSSENSNYTALLNQLYSRHSSAEKSDLTALSLFSGCGGFSLGFSAANFKVKAFLELEPDLREIYKLNFPHSIEMGGDITNVSNEDLYTFRQTVGDIDVIIGGPPCQGFSLSGKRKRDDPRNTLFRHYLRFVDTFKPKIAVLENVRLLTSMKNLDGGYVKDDLYREFESHGYKVCLFEINAKDFGVPQHRERVIFLAIRNDLGATPSFPSSEFGEPGDLFSTKKPHRTFADACSDLEFLESGGVSNDNLHKAVTHPAHVIEWLWDVPEGLSAHDNEDPAKRPPSGYNTTYKRQVWEEPAATVQTTFGMISGCRNVHPIATRSLTIREAARLQAFPDEYKFAGTLGTIRTGIGNAVPPLLAYAIANHIRKLL
jgi:DNA (cytosine-5)-methyltransferase 1